MELLGNLAVDGDLLFQVLHDIKDARLGRVYAVTCPLEVDAVTGNAGPGEGNDHAAKLVADLAEDLAAARHKMLVMLGLHRHGILDDVVQLLDARL